MEPADFKISGTTVPAGWGDGKTLVSGAVVNMRRWEFDYLEKANIG